jgi:hypothetical protein
MTRRVTPNPSPAVYTAFRIVNPANEIPSDPSTRNVANTSGVMAAAANNSYSQPEGPSFAGQMREHATLPEHRSAPREPTGVKLPAPPA